MKNLLLIICIWMIAACGNTKKPHDTKKSGLITVLDNVNNGIRDTIDWIDPVNHFQNNTAKILYDMPDHGVGTFQKRLIDDSSAEITRYGFIDSMVYKGESIYMNVDTGTIGEIFPVTIIKKDQRLFFITQEGRIFYKPSAFCQCEDCWAYKEFKELKLDK